jgi:signal transduction histidine kinase
MTGELSLRRLADGLFVLCAALTLGTVAFSVIELARDEVKLAPVDFSTGFIFLADGLVFAAVGTLIAHRQPRNTMGWLLLVVGTFWAVGLTLGIYADYGINVNPGAVPAPALVNALGVWMWVPAVGIMGTFVLLLYPDGHLPTPRWRWLSWLSAAVMTVLSIAFMTSPTAFSDSSLEGVVNPLGVTLPAWVTVAEDGVFVLFPACMLASAAAAIVRYRRSRGVLRLQMKWLVTVGAFFASFFGFMLLLGIVPSIHDNQTLVAIFNIALPLTFPLFPLAIGAAILRYRLYDIDVVISRSLVFGALATFITVVYVTIVVGIGHLIGYGGRPNLALSVAATAVVAVAFEPVRNRLQRVANRLVYGDRATPYEVLSSFADRVGGAYDARELLARMARTVAQGVDAERAQIWLRRDGRFNRAATWPEQTDESPPAVDQVADDRVVSVADQGETLGAISVKKPSGKELTPVEDRLLHTLAAQAGPVLRNVRLIEDLRTSRQRLVATQDEERRRLERNLHDGAQQSLVAFALMLRLMQSTLASEGDGVARIVDRVADELGLAIQELRDLARGIYPAILADRGLGAALSSLAERSTVPVELDDRLGRRLPADIERALYFITAELLASLAHDDATEVAIDLDQSADMVTLRIRHDGGTAEDPMRAPTMQRLVDRAAVVDASLEVSDRPGPGLQLLCSVPVSGFSSNVSPDAAVGAVPLGSRP